MLVDGYVIVKTRRLQVLTMLVTICSSLNLKIVTSLVLEWIRDVSNFKSDRVDVVRGGSSSRTKLE